MRSKTFFVIALAGVLVLVCLVSNVSLACDKEAKQAAMVASNNGATKDAAAPAAEHVGCSQPCSHKAEAEGAMAANGTPADKGDCAKHAAAAATQANGAAVTVSDTHAKSGCAKQAAAEAALAANGQAAEKGGCAKKAAAEAALVANGQAAEKKSDCPHAAKQALLAQKEAAENDGEVKSEP